MLIAATNTVTIHAVPGHAEVLGPLLREMVDALREVQGCIAYAVAQKHDEPNLWIVTGQWATLSDMEGHFNSPAQEIYSVILNSKFIRSLQFDSHLLT